MYNNPDSSPAAMTLQPSKGKPRTIDSQMEALSDCRCLHALWGQALFRVTNVFRRPPGLTTISRKGPAICGRVSTFPPPHVSGGFPSHFRLREGLEGPGTPQMRSPTTAPGPQRQPPAYLLLLTGDRSVVAARPRLSRCYATAPGPRDGLSGNGPKDPSEARAG